MLSFFLIHFTIWFAFIKTEWVGSNKICFTSIALVGLHKANSRKPLLAISQTGNFNVVSKSQHVISQEVSAGRQKASHSKCIGQNV